MTAQIPKPWNKDRIVGQKKPLQISQVWGIRIRLELESFLVVQLESPVRYLGIEVDDALEISESIEI
jgi:hypothetical protein